MPRKPRPTLDSATNLKVWLAWVCGEHVVTDAPIRSARQLYAIAITAAQAEVGPEKAAKKQAALRDVAVHLYDAMQTITPDLKRAA